MDLQRLSSFLDLLHRFQRVDRLIFRKGEDRRENDAEHSYQLAMTAWYLNDKDDLGMDTRKLVLYALAHDLAEVYAGDTYAYTTDAEERASKETREAAAVARIASEFPEFPELIEAIHAYERREDREAKLVYALDKLLPTLGIYLDGGRTWREDGVTLEMMKTYKADKIAESPEVNRYYLELVAALEREPGLFAEQR